MTEKDRDIIITVENGEMDEQEIAAYVAHVRKNNPGQNIRSLSLTIDGDYVDMRYELEPLRFQRIRRITGYLVGTLDRFNDAKRAEEHDRVKHITV